MILVYRRPAAWKSAACWATVRSRLPNTASMTNLVTAGLGVALLPRLLLLDAPPSVVVLPMRQPTLGHSLYTCRFDTRGVTASIRQLAMYLREAVAEL